MPTEHPIPTGETVDCTGILIGNSDLDCPEWVPTAVEAGTTPLPAYPLPRDLPMPVRPQPMLEREPRAGSEV